jgi:hypothetical protein
MSIASVSAAGDRDGKVRMRVPARMGRREKSFMQDEVVNFEEP